MIPAEWRLMVPARWNEIQALFEELIELPPSDRVARLAAISDRDAALYDSIDSLIKADSEAHRWLASVESALLPPRDKVTEETVPDADPLGLVGGLLGRFHIEALLGADGMGVVYRARDTRLDRAIALKVPRPEHRINISANRRFIHEARTVAALDHPNVCTIHEVDTGEDGIPFLAMPLYSGETLRARLARDVPLPVAEVVNIASQVAKGLAAVHDAGVVHRDVKPGNIMLVAQGSVKILDFGLAKVRDLSVTQSGELLGTVSYMAPEQIRSQPVGTYTDLWALGVVMYEMITGRRPFGGERSIAVAHAIVHDEVIPPRVLQPSIPPALDDIVCALLEKDPTRRLASAHEVADRLAAVDAEQPESAPNTGRRRKTSWTHDRRITRAMLTTGMVIVAGGVFTTHQSIYDSPSTVDTARSIVVLPFMNLSNDREQDYFSDGITEELISHLAKLPELRVTARTTSFRFKGQNPDVREVGRALDVATVLQGSVRRNDRVVRISAQLVDAATGYYLWSETYDRELNDVLAIQDEISEAIVSSLRIRLPGTGGVVGLRASSTRSIEAYDLYLRGRHLWNQRTDESLARAAEYFRQAVALDPGYADAYSGLADVEIAPRSGIPSERFARAKLAASTALMLDSANADAHFSMGWIAMWYDRDWPAAERHLLKGIALNPNHVWGIGWYAAYLAATGRVEESLAVIQRSHTLDPLSYPHATYVGTHYLWLHRDREAIPYFHKALDLAPGFFMAHWGLALAYLRQGRAEEALVELRYDGGDFVGLHRLGLLGYANALAGHEVEARRILDELETATERGEYVPAVDPALVHIGLGDTESALDWLERLETDRGARTFLIDPLFDPVRTEPRFQRLSATLIPVGVPAPR